jgi:hypothetical protein
MIVARVITFYLSNLSIFCQPPTIQYSGFNHTMKFLEARLGYQYQQVPWIRRSGCIYPLDQKLVIGTYPIISHFHFFANPPEIGIHTKDTAMDSFSSFLADLLVDDAIGSVDVDQISIVHDAQRLPSTSLINMNRRAMGMKDFHDPIFFKKERKDKNRWEEGLVLTSGSCPKLAVQDPASTTKAAKTSRPGLGSKQRSSASMLPKPTRQSFPGSPSPNVLPTRRSEGLRNSHRWTSCPTSMSCDVNEEEVTSPQAKNGGSAASKSMTRRSCLKLAVQYPASTTKAAARSRPGLGNKQRSDLMLLRPTRRSFPGSPTPEDLPTRRSEGLRNSHRWSSCPASLTCYVNEEEEVTSSQAKNGATASMSTTTRADRRTFSRHLVKDSKLAMPTRRHISPTKEERSSAMDDTSVCSAESDRPEINKGSRYSLLQNGQRQSDLALVMPRRGVGLISNLEHCWQTSGANKEFDEDQISCLVSRALSLLNEELSVGPNY